MNICRAWNFGQIDFLHSWTNLFFACYKIIFFIQFYTCSWKTKFWWVVRMNNSSATWSCNNFTANNVNPKPFKWETETLDNEANSPLRWTECIKSSEISTSLGFAFFFHPENQFLCGMEILTTCQAYCSNLWATFIILFPSPTSNCSWFSLRVTFPDE